MVLWIEICTIQIDSLFLMLREESVSWQQVQFILKNMLKAKHFLNEIWLDYQYSNTLIKPSAYYHKKNFNDKKWSVLKHSDIYISPFNLAAMLNQCLTRFDCYRTCSNADHTQTCRQMHSTSDLSFWQGKLSCTFLNDKTSHDRGDGSLLLVYFWKAAQVYGKKLHTT